LELYQPLNGSIYKNGESASTVSIHSQISKEKDLESGVSKVMKSTNPVLAAVPEASAPNHAVTPSTPQPLHKSEGNENVYSQRTMDKMEVQKFVITQNMNSMAEVEKLQEKLSMYKAHMPLGKLFFLGLLAGWWCGLAVILVVTIAGGIPVDVRTSWPCLPKLVAGLFFPVAIFLILIFGGELFTGNAMSLLIGLFAKRVTVFELMYNWSVVLVSNFVGCVFTVFMFAELTDLFAHEPWESFAKGIAITKINLKPEVAFLRAIPANALVCTSVLLGQQARDMLGKLVSPRRETHDSPLATHFRLFFTLS
jgi:formate/nitrite transporter FocA (FNT family)